VHMDGVCSLARILSRLLQYKLKDTVKRPASPHPEGSVARTLGFVRIREICIPCAMMN
jgi:hypothetical protein